MPTREEYRKNIKYYQAYNKKRKGNFEAIAIRDFDTEEDEFYPVESEGEEIACRRELCKIEIIKK